jgi:hypothetical protein
MYLFLVKKNKKRPQSTRHRIESIRVLVVSPFLQPFINLIQVYHRLDRFSSYLNAIAAFTAFFQPSYKESRLESSIVGVNS